MSDDRSAVEKLADDFTAYERQARDHLGSYYEGQRDAWDQAESDLRAAIEADRAAGWRSPTEVHAYMVELGDTARARDEARAEIERLRSNVTTEGETADFISRITDERDRAEARLAEVRDLLADPIYVDSWDGYAVRLDDIRAALDRDADNEVPFVAVGNGEAPPWGDDRTCPECGQPDLPLEDSDPPGLHYIAHCGKAWMRGPIDLPGGRR